jgi:AcrR family transcriptional regulator
LLSAGRRLFAKRGYDATTVQDIVDAARSSVGNFYFYFENKGALLRTLLEGAIAAAWGRGDELMASAPPGPSRLAVMVYANAVGYLVADKDLIRIVFGDESDLSVQQRLADLHVPRIRGVIRANVPDYPEELLDMAVTVWLGGARDCVRRAVLGQLGTDILEVAAFLTRWNLRGLGVPESQIDAAIAYADRQFRPIVATVRPGVEQEQTSALGAVSETARQV